MVRQIMCGVFGHKVKRRKVRRSGEGYIGRCRWCNKRMDRTKDGWRLSGPPA